MRIINSSYSKIFRQIREGSITRIDTTLYLFVVVYYFAILKVRCLMIFAFK